MTYLVDANVFSEPTKPVPNNKVIDRLTANEGNLVVDAIVVGELCVGILALPGGRKRTQPEQWFRGRRTNHRLPFIGRDDQPTVG